PAACGCGIGLAESYSDMLTYLLLHAKGDALKSHLIRRPLCVLCLCASVLAAPPQGRANESEEFTGPFPSWRDLRRDYKAVGDGKVDDTAALQKALDDLIKHQKACVLYIPSGTYRLTDTVKTVRKAHTDCQGIAVIGEDPATTTLIWDGAKGG